jgi:beta-lactam-binding protein with PASTA domain
VNLNYRPDKGGDTAPTGVQVPDVRQLTEGAARRVLASVGLMLDASQGARELAPESAIGQAMLQQPKPGERVAVGARVLVVFARADTPRDNR